MGVIKDFWKEFTRRKRAYEIKEYRNSKKYPRENKLKESKIKELRSLRQTLEMKMNRTKLDPRGYETEDELFVGMLEDMGLNDRFFENTRALEDIAGAVRVELRKISRQNPEVGRLMRKPFQDLTEEDVIIFKQKIEEAGKMKIDPNGNLEYLHMSENERPNNVNTQDYMMKYSRANFKINASEYTRELITNQCEMKYDQNENNHKGGNIDYTARRSIYNKDGLEMKEEEHHTEMPRQNLTEEQAKTLVNGEQDNISTIARMQGTISKILERENVNGIRVTFKEDGRLLRNSLHTMNTANDIKNLKILEALEEAILNGREDNIRRHDEQIRNLSDEDKKEILKEDINKSTKKDILKRMAQEQGLLDRDEQTQTH